MACVAHNDKKRLSAEPRLQFEQGLSAYEDCACFNENSREIGIGSLGVITTLQILAPTWTI